MVKSKRKLRSNTRKDYAKMVSVDSDIDIDGEHVQEPGFSAAGQKKNNNNNGGGEIINQEFFLSEGESVSSDPDDGVESSEEEVRIARKELDELKKKQRDLARKTKLEKIAEEKEAVRKSLEKVSEKKKRSDHHVTVASLRKMDDVVERVDKLMDRNLRINKCATERYSDSDSDSGASRVDLVRSSSQRRSRRIVEEEKEVAVNHRSGKSKSITSHVLYPQEWPHAHLALHFVNRKKDYEELSIAEFCAGYSAILEFAKGDEKKYHIIHLKELMFLATKFTWKSILNYHGACLMEIERGHLNWGDSFLVLQSTTLAGSSLIHNTNNGANGGTNGRSSSKFGGSSFHAKSESILFCNKYQKGICLQSRDHFGFFYGENRMLKHICAKCWLEGKKMENHPETADECPYKG